MGQYNLTTINYPVLTGKRLQLVAAALDNAFLRPLLLPQLLNSGGLLKLRALQLDEAPTHNPLYHCDSLPVEPFEPSRVLGKVVRGDGVGQSGFRSVRDLAQAFRSGDTTPLKIARQLLDAIEKGDRGERPLRAFSAIDQAEVLAQATASTERIAAGQSVGVFDGVPIAFKEELDVQGYPTTVGTRFLGRNPASRDATVVARLRAAGATIIGKTNMHEIGINPRSGNPHHGTVRNPYDLDRDAGGSSSGSAAAVAAGLCPLAVGADGGGSIRIPAALCGVVGLKATYGRISGHGSFPLDWSVGHLGPMGASVDDVVLAYAAMAGADPLDPHTQHQPALNVSDFEDEVLGDQPPLRLGIYREWFNHAEPEVVAICEAMLHQLADCGAIIEEIEIPELDELRIAHAVTILSEMAASMANYPDNWNDLSAATRISLTIGKAATSVDYLQAQRVRTRAMGCFAEVFKQVDVVISPSTAMVAPLIPTSSLSHGLADLGSVTELMRFAVPGNMTGLPAISFPVGYSQAGLPVGMQAMGRPWEEQLLFRVARTAERLADRRVPPGYYDLLG